MMEVTPHLKSVLKNYQHSATKSLQGPGLSLVAPKREPPSSPEVPKDEEEEEEEEFVPAVPFPVQQLPILTTADTSCSERTETCLEGESISCFVVGGERRLCLPQVLNSVLRDFSLQQINQECDQLQIYCSRCTPEQLNVLKNQGILPSGAPSCGLITKTDAERLCSALLCGGGTQTRVPRKGGLGLGLSIPVYHECFGRARGLCFPELYTSKEAKCFECGDCQASLSPRQFVCHVHRDLENRTVHWGFDSANWRSYVHVPLEHVEREHFVKILDEMREQYEGRLPFPPPPPPPPVVVVEPVVKRKQVTAADIIKDHELPLKKQKLNEYLNSINHHIPYNSMQHATCIQQIYANLDPLYIHQCLQEFSVNRHLSAFKPVVQSIKESKLRHATALGRYPQPPADAPVLQHPERVVPMSESERFERTYQPNVALAPPTPKKLRYGRAMKTEPTSPPQESPPVDERNNNHDDDETGEVKPQPPPPPVAPVSVVQSTANPKYNPEIELSTDTEDSASEASSEKLLDKIEDLVKGVEPTVRERLVEFARGMSREQERLLQDNRAKDERIAELEARNAELLRELAALRCSRTVENGHDDDDDGHNSVDDGSSIVASAPVPETETTAGEVKPSVIATVGEQKDAILKTAPE